MDAVKTLIFGDGGAAKKAAEQARQQAAVSAAQQQSLAQEEQARADTQAGKTVAVPRGRRLLLDGVAGGSNLATTVG
jgi:pyruvate/2-oxoglutarate dehydrogenase complex dihydrolipoamide acyltransferase (E2) component